MPNHATATDQQVTALVDFGSTFTKVAVVDIETGDLLSSGQSTTTVHTDVLEGLAAAFTSCRPELGAVADLARRCCSSAGGGLRMVVLGLEEDITTQAARQVALNAGGRIAETFSGLLGPDDIDRLAGLEPDLILLSGGTNGGDTACLVGNAKSLAKAGLAAVIVVAGNVEAQAEAGRHLESAGRNWLAAPNVLPEIGVVETEKVQIAIRDVFISHVIGGKNLSASVDFTQMVTLPTPDAVRQGGELLSLGIDADRGFGPLLVVDVGGATTDVYSVVRSTSIGSQRKELVPSATTSRTVEADLGLRWSAEGVVDAAGGLGLLDEDRIARLTDAAAVRVGDPSFLPNAQDEVDDDVQLAQLAAVIAIHRHAGRQRVGIGPDGVSIRLEGRDLREVPLIVATGGVFRSNPDVDFATAFNEAFGAFERNVLGPRDVRIVIDRKYVLAAAGLLSSSHPRAAFRLMSDQLAAPSVEGALT